MTSSLRCYSGPSGVKAIMDWLSASQMMSRPVFRFHLPSEFVQPVLILTEDFGHTADGEDVVRRGHDQAAVDAIARAQFQDRSSSTRGAG